MVRKCGKFRLRPRRRHCLFRQNLRYNIDMEEEITLVGQGDEDYDTGKYLLTSPIGQGLVGKTGSSELQ